MQREVAAWQAARNACGRGVDWRFTTEDARIAPAVFCHTWEDLRAVTALAHAPIHFRHVTSAPMLDEIRRVSGSTVQTSPHLLLPLAAGRRTALTVLPTPPCADERRSLAGRLIDEVDVIASDHVSPPLGAPTGPGLQTQQHFLSAMLTVVDERGLPLDAVWPKVTSAPAEIFGVERQQGLVVVDPSAFEVTTWPRQAPDRAPYLGRWLRGQVVAIAADDQFLIV